MLTDQLMPPQTTVGSFKNLLKKKPKRILDKQQKVLIQPLRCDHQQARIHNIVKLHSTSAANTKQKHACKEQITMAMSVCRKLRGECWTS